MTSAADRWLDPRQTRIPYWLRADNSGRLGYAIATVLDAITEHLWAGISERWPELASEEGLLALGRDLRIPRASSESIASYRGRLIGAPVAWENAGTNIGMLTQAQPYMLPEIPKMRIVSGDASHARWTTLNADGSREYLRTASPVWDWDSAQPDVDALTSSRRWWLIMYATPSLSVHPDFVIPSDTISAGCSLLAQNGVDILSIANAFRSAGAIGWGLIVAFDPASFDPDGSSAHYPDGTWFREYVPGTVDYNRDPTARYLDRYLRTPGDI